MNLTRRQLILAGMWMPLGGPLLIAIWRHLLMTGEGIDSSVANNFVLFEGRLYVACYASDDSEPPYIDAERLPKRFLGRIEVSGDIVAGKACAGVLDVGTPFYETSISSREADIWEIVVPGQPQVYTYVGERMQEAMLDSLANGGDIQSGAYTAIYKPL